MHQELCTEWRSLWPNNDAIKKLEAQMARLEAALSEQAAAAAPTVTAATAPGGFVTDPAPWPVGRWIHPALDMALPVSCCRSRPLAHPGRRPRTVEPFDFGSFQSPCAATAASLGQLGTIGDPPPIDIRRFIRRLPINCSVNGASRANPLHRYASLRGAVKLDSRKTGIRYLSPA